MRMLATIITNTIALAVATWMLTGMWFEGPTSGSAEISEKALRLVIVAVIFGVVNTLVGTILRILSFPFIILSLGFLLLVINALLLMLTAKFANVFNLGFHVDGFWTAVIGSIIITIASWGVRAVIGEEAS